MCLSLAQETSDGSNGSETMRFNFLTSRFQYSAFVGEAYCSQREHLPHGASGGQQSSLHPGQMMWSILVPSSHTKSL